MRFFVSSAEIEEGRRRANRERRHWKNEAVHQKHERQRLEQSIAIWDARNESYALGRKVGYSNGQHHGYGYGQKVGYQHGVNHGYERGYNDGGIRGYSYGRNDGREDANRYGHGYREPRVEAASTGRHHSGRRTYQERGYEQDGSHGHRHGHGHGYANQSNAHQHERSHGHGHRSSALVVREQRASRGYAENGYKY
ncbi:hypothetical protein MMC14_008629 [Varicellaria rhodocarpa]|nr:hypothetical protein [Varicellaria rhodocarpa]